MSHPAAFHIEVDRTQDTVRLAVHGELDLATAPELEEHISRSVQEAAHLVIDLRQLAFLDSTGLRVLVQTDALAQRDGFDLTIVRGPAPIARLFEVSGLDEHLPLVDAPPEPA